MAKPCLQKSRLLNCSFFFFAECTLFKSNFVQILTQQTHNRTLESIGTGRCVTQHRVLIEVELHYKDLTILTYFSHFPQGCESAGLARAVSISFTVII